jgi:hypothetical protein
VVYSTARGLHELEIGVHATLGDALATRSNELGALVECTCLEGLDDLHQETWYKGKLTLPLHAGADELGNQSSRFKEACAVAGLGGWQVRSVMVCTPRFNSLLDQAGSKGAVLAHALGRLLRHSCQSSDGDGLSFFIDKHGGRNTYAAQIQHALSDGMVVARQEGMARSSYEVLGLGREVQLTFQPRADGEYLCVALASMVSKYLRELLMLEFNQFWQEHVPGLKPTAGYPGDAGRFLTAIRPPAAKLGIPENALWRRK